MVELSLKVCRLSLHFKPRKEANKQANEILFKQWRKQPIVYTRFKFLKKQLQ